jgi:hypothetical protein
MSEADRTDGVSADSQYAIAKTHQQTGSRSTISLQSDQQPRAIPAPCTNLGQTVNGAWLNKDTTPVGVGLDVVPVHEAVSPSWSCSVSPAPVAVAPACVRFKLGQQSGLSSEHPMRGTCRAPPSGK